MLWLSMSLPWETRDLCSCIGVGGGFMFLFSSAPDYKVGAEAAPSRAHLVPRAVER